MKIQVDSMHVPLGLIVVEIDIVKGGVFDHWDDFHQKNFFFKRMKIPYGNKKIAQHKPIIFFLGHNNFLFYETKE